MGGGITNLRTPAGVAVGCHVVFLAFLRGDWVRESFDVRFIWLMKIHVDGFLVTGRKGYSKIMSGVYVLKDI